MENRKIAIQVKELNKYDATGRYILMLNDLLNELGYDAFISADKNNTDISSVKSVQEAAREAEIIFHQMTGDIDFLKSSIDPSKKNILTYHNITPGEFYFEYNQELALNLKRAREEMKGLSGKFAATVSLSEYSSKELADMGFAKNFILPIYFKEDLYADVTPRKIDGFSDAHDIVLSVGTIAPHKKVEDIIKSFFLYNKYINPNSELVLIGGMGPKMYVDLISELIKKLRLEKKVIFKNKTSDEELKAYYQNAKVYLCMSEHEGFCFPLMESMYFNLPIIAFESSAIPETLAGSGILLTEKNFEEVAEMLDIVVSNDDLRRRIVSDQKEVLNTLYTKEVVKNKLDEIMTKIA